MARPLPRNRPYPSPGEGRVISSSLGEAEAISLAFYNKHQSVNTLSKSCNDERKSVEKKPYVCSSINIHPEMGFEIHAPDCDAGRGGEINANLALKMLSVNSNDINNRSANVVNGNEKISNLKRP